METCRFTAAVICTQVFRAVKIKINNRWHLNKPSSYGIHAMVSRIKLLHTTLVPAVL